ncbi:hypothetical protein G5I_03975 [Acromyrmex echinatior]|uniref:Uncharacterized protein n=1 Tax=Acromyrmex echinatior TaxID=103372 RepID=F4WEG9_ACREC|nr:hypothetical protein G5I_03975 [Acromyrmex echinatior]
MTRNKSNARRYTPPLLRTPFFSPYEVGTVLNLPGKSSNPINNGLRDYDVWFDVLRSSRNFSPTNISWAHATRTSGVHRWKSIP